MFICMYECALYIYSTLSDTKRQALLLLVLEVLQRLLRMKTSPHILSIETKYRSLVH